MKATEHKETGEKMQVYEVGYLIVPSVPEEKVTDEVSFIHSQIEKNGGAIIAEEFPKIRELSYSMSQSIESKKHNYDSAYFGWVKFEMPVLGLAKIEEQLKQSKNILRHLTMKTIRENTMFSERIPNIAKKPEDLSPKDEQGAPPVVEEKKVVLEDDIDKSIDALVIN